MRREFVRPDDAERKVQANRPVVHPRGAVQASFAETERYFISGAARRGAAKQRQRPVVLDVPVKAKARVEDAETDPERTPEEGPIVVIDRVSNTGYYDDRKRAHVLKSVVQTLRLSRVAVLSQTL